MDLPQVIVKIVDDIALNLEEGGSLSLDQLAQIAPPGADAIIAAIRAALPDVILDRLFDDLQACVSDATSNDPTYAPPNFENFLEIICPPAFDTSPLVAALALWVGVVEFAYTVDPTEPAAVIGTTNPLFALQGYLAPAPDGIGVQSAWAKGADGTGVNLIDIEHAWFLAHEDLPQNIPLLAGINGDKLPGHGTAMLGIIAAIDNGVGVVGIAPKTAISLMAARDRATTGANSVDHVARMIGRACARLSPGDVLLLELQTTGNDHPPIDLARAVFEAILLCTTKGIIVVEAGGNGNSDLDTMKDVFGKRVLSRLAAGEFRDSGAILVGSSTSTVPHTVNPTSNFGSRIDCYAWGENVFTTGSRKNTVEPNSYFDAPNGNPPTGPPASGTSAASAIIAGVCILIQHLQKTVTGSSTAPPLSPAEMRQVLSDPANGTDSFSINDRIGVMPDFAKILANEFI